MRIAMWSGPRNLSTALMYSFARHPDCTVWDEPFYAAYLSITGVAHPMRAEILAAGEQDPNVVISRCIGSIPGDKPHFYQKHMTQHMVPDFDRSWLDQVTNVFLIRHPARVISSYAAKRENPTLQDIGFVQQAELYDLVLSRGHTATVIDSYDIRADPGRTLRRLCTNIGLEFDPAMLSWPSGGHAADGVWAPHWYGAVWQSTGFAAPEGDLPVLPAALQPVCDAAMPFYDRMRAQAI